MVTAPFVGRIGISIGSMSLPRVYVAQVVRFAGSGRYPGWPVSPLSIDRTCREVRLQCDIDKPVAAHALRHAFAVHLRPGAKRCRPVPPGDHDRSTPAFAVSEPITSISTRSIAGTIARRSRKRLRRRTTS
jgi:hypothetical protein